ncbi:hypothetical protein LX64_02584 [Chitinophaga skermanii]|uniref:Uncharacterized protein n=1 Tax=Chitinophaga skermanii TaxID=331697 RepID=A0A327QL79_9BACT|nr:hypothetical protein [Chitinophaga skermanii]RAJ05426.1 hypothetical protein LX64_02584 [Chitinophaga skermanii]
MENPETNKKYINDHIAIWNSVDGVSGGLAGDDFYTNSSITTNVRLNISKYFNKNEKLDAHSFDVKAPNAILDAIKSGELKPLKLQEKSKNDVMN